MPVLRDYQSRIVRELQRCDDDVLIELPTGSGKSLVVIALVPSWLRAGKRVLIASPQEVIERHFTQRCYEQLQCGSRSISVPAELVRAARDGDSSVRSIEEYLATEDASHALACTHASLTRVRPPTEVQANAGDVLVVDEAHHASALGLSQFVTAWRQAGGRLLFVTATGYRNDKLPVSTSGMRVIQRTLAQHMLEGFAPSTINSSVEAVSHAGAAVGERVYYGDEPPVGPLRERLVSGLVAAWERDQRPKLIVRVPPLRGGTAEFIGEIVTAFTNERARVLNITGSELRDKRRFLAALSCEQALFPDSAVDVLVGVQRVTEGLDWPLCSAIYNVGLPRGIATTVQLLGRAMRHKPASIAREHRTQVQLRFFVPCSDQAGVEAMPVSHARQTLLICAYLESQRTGHQWHAVSRLHSAAQASLGEAAASALVSSVPYIDPALRAEIEAALATVSHQLHAEGLSVTETLLYSSVVRSHPQLDQAAVRQILVERRMSRDTHSAQRLLDRLAGSLQPPHRPSPEAWRDAFDAVSQEFVERTQEHVQIADGAAEQVLRLTGRRITYFAKRLEETKPLDTQQLERCVHAFLREEERLPEASDRVPIEPGSVDTWTSVDLAMRRRTRSWSILRGENLSQFCSLVMACHAGWLDDFLAAVPGTTNIEQAILRNLQERHLLKTLGKHKPVCTALTDCSGWWFVELDDPVAQTLLPLLCAAVLNLRENLSSWLGLDAALRPSARDKREYTESYAGREVVLKLTEPAVLTVQQNRPFEIQLQAGDTGRMSIRRCHLVCSPEDRGYETLPPQAGNRSVSQRFEALHLYGPLPVRDNAPLQAGVPRQKLAASPSAYVHAHWSEIHGAIDVATGQCVPCPVDWLDWLRQLPMPAATVRRLRA